MSRRKPIIGLAGGIGAGKSTVARMFASLGAAVIDADALAHAELADPEVVATLAEWWGERAVRAGAVDRRGVADIVFADGAALKQLEDLLYPRIARRHEALIDRYDRDDRVSVIVIDAPKLYEAGIDALCDAVVFVEASAEVRAERLSADRGWSPEEVTRRERHQEPLDKKRAMADYIVVNNSRTDALSSDVERVFHSVLASFPS